MREIDDIDHMNLLRKHLPRMKGTKDLYKYPLVKRVAETLSLYFIKMIT